MTSPASLQHRAQIEDALLSYCRGIDRLHAPSIEAAFHRDAMLEGYGSDEPVQIDAFVPRVIGSLREKFVATQHRLSNVTITLDHDRALVESYVLAYHVAHHDDHQHDGRRVLITFNGRYIDQFERRDDAWRIARRQLRIDWSDISPMGEAMQGAYIPSGRDGSADPVFS
ncbi:hypothetical protein BH23ACT3_BH23ACT3_04410 [soil metagenome]